jgi:hypothetical protein
MVHIASKLGLQKILSVASYCVVRSSLILSSLVMEAMFASETSTLTRAT